VLIIDLAQVDHESLIKTLRQRTDKTPIVIAIGRDSEITPDCAEIFHIFHPLCSGADLGIKLRGRWVSCALMNSAELRMRRSVQNQIKFLESFHEKYNQILLIYQNANSKIGPEWYLTCPWNGVEFQKWFIRLWNHRLKPFLQANIIQGVQVYGDKGQNWTDITHWIKNNFTWSNDEQIESLSSADCGLSRIGDDPLVVMLQRLQAASRIATSDSDSEITLPTPIY